jgi:antitoxin component YwqK of YwqJK toxin-antitoxin module
VTNSLGKENGIYKTYHENGQLYQEVNYIYGKKNGIYKSYHENGCELFENNSNCENLALTNSLGKENVIK